MHHNKPRDEKDVMNLVKELNVKFVRLWFTDILGQLKSFAIPVEELEMAFAEGMGFDGSSIKGFARIDESDMIARPDPTTLQFFLGDLRKVLLQECSVIFTSQTELLTKVTQDTY